MFRALQSYKYETCGDAFLFIFENVEKSDVLTFSHPLSPNLPEITLKSLGKQDERESRRNKKVQKQNNSILRGFARNNQFRP